jgi:lipid A 3-O-deacylase
LTILKRASLMIGCMGLAMAAGAMAQVASSSVDAQTGGGGSAASAGLPGMSFVQDAASRDWEYGVLAQGGFGVTEDRGGFKFFMLGGHAGRVLTPQVGSGLLKGDFEYAAEVFPFWQSYTPKFEKASCFPNPQPGTSFIGPGLYCSPLYTVGGTFTGVSITPIILRWNFTHGKRWMPWVQGAGGVLWTNHKYPAFGSGELSLANNGPDANTSVWNFTPQFGVGTHFFVKPQRSIDFSANAVHISSASLGDKNPGVNASVQFSVGYSWWK